MTTRRASRASVSRLPPYNTKPKVGDIVIGGDGHPWRVQCMNDDGSTLGLVPVGWRRRLYWWLRLRGWAW